MANVAVAGTKGTGGAEWSPPARALQVDGASVLLVGDQAAIACSLHTPPVLPVITTGSTTLKVNGVAVALDDSETSCGHPLDPSTCPNRKLQA